MSAVSVGTASLRKFTQNFFGLEIEFCRFLIDFYAPLLNIKGVGSGVIGNLPGS